MRNSHAYRHPTVVQLGQTGNVLGPVRQPPARTTVFRSIRTAWWLLSRPSDPGKVVRIDGTGSVETLLQDERTIPSPIAIAAEPRSGDILVADNETDRLLLLPARQTRGAKAVLHVKGHENNLQTMSVAFCKDGHLLLASAVCGDPRAFAVCVPKRSRL